MVSGLFLLLAACALSVLVVVRGRLSRLDSIGIGLFVVVVACVAVGGLLSGALRDRIDGDGRALLACAVGPLLALSWRGEQVGRYSGVVIGGVSTVLLALGLAAHAAVLVPLGMAQLLMAIALVASSAVAASAATASAMRAVRLPSRLLRARGLGEAGAGAALALSSLVALIEVGFPVPALRGTWPAIAAVGVALAASSRAARLPVSSRDVAIVVVITALLGVLVPLVALPTVAATVAAGVVLGGALEMWSLRPSVSPPLSAPSSMVSPSSLSAEPVPLAGIQALVPLLDDALQRRPGRPRILSRTSARRLIEAASDRAWRAHPQARQRPPVDVTGADDTDVDGDASELAEALCAVLDNAFREQLQRAEGRVSVVVRAAPQTISFEIDDPTTIATASATWTPFLSAATRDGDRPGYGVGLARARLIVERHGGQLHVRGGESGAVQITLPRRVNRGPIGLA